MNLMNFMKHIKIKKRKKKEKEDKAQNKKMVRLTLKALFISFESPFPIATVIKRLHVDVIIVLKTAIKDIILPSTEKRP